MCDEFAQLENFDAAGPARMGMTMMICDGEAQYPCAFQNKTPLKPASILRYPSSIHNKYKNR
jgi:hypothetical protein